MNERIGMNFTRVEQLAASIGSATVAIEAILGQLDEQVASDSESWTGEASNAYRRAHSEWTAAAAEMTRILGDAQRSTVTIAERHRASEQQARSLWK